MRVLIVNESDTNGGAARAAYRLFQGMNKIGDARALINTEVTREGIVRFIKMLPEVSIDFTLGSDFFISADDAKSKADIFSRVLIMSISWIENNIEPVQ